MRAPCPVASRYPDVAQPLQTRPCGVSALFALPVLASCGSYPVATRLPRCGRAVGKPTACPCTAAWLQACKACCRGTALISEKPCLTMVMRSRPSGSQSKEELHGPIRAGRCCPAQSRGACRSPDQPEADHGPPQSRRHRKTAAEPCSQGVRRAARSRLDHGHGAHSGPRTALPGAGSDLAGSPVKHRNATKWVGAAHDLIQSDRIALQKLTWLRHG